LGNKFALLKSVKQNNQFKKCNQRGSQKNSTLQEASQKKKKITGGKNKTRSYYRRHQPIFFFYQTSWNIISMDVYKLSFSKKIV
jgi:hypothetical protein